MEKICPVSGSTFVITEADLEYYEKIGVPTPTLSPVERSRRRLARCNQYNLYWRKCAATGKSILTGYAPEIDLNVVDDEYYWSDGWNASDFGREYDFSRSFFEQWAELEREIPHLPTHSGQNENAEYVSYAGWNKDCYLIFHADHNRDCYYCSHTFYDQDCADCFYVNRSELCYGCIASENLYNCRFVRDSKNCADAWFLKDCIGCKNCFGSANLRNKEFYFFNEPLSKEEYQSKLGGLDLRTRDGIAHLQDRFEAFLLEQPHKAMNGVQNEGVSGDYLSNCKNVLESFHVENSRDSKFLLDCQKCVDCYDLDSWGGTGAELLYECETCGEGAYRVFFSSYIFDSAADIWYSYSCHSSHDLFGCAGMRHAEYCILNRQYSKEDYEDLKAKIIDEMKARGEWGEYFPAHLTHYAYNETIAHDLMPLTKDEALRRGYRWREEDASERGVPSCRELPEMIAEVSDAIADETCGCVDCGKLYKFQKSEVALYHKLGVPLPSKCFRCRHQERLKLVNPSIVYNRQCSECASELCSTFAPERSEQILCERCFASHTL